MIAANGQRKPYTRLFSDIQKAVSTIPDFKGDVFLMMAVCVRESMGVPWFCKCDSLYKANMNVVRTHFGMEVSNEFLRAITVKGGTNAGKIPKFRFEPGWFGLNQSNPDTARLQPVPLIIMSCSFGMAQKGALWMVPGVPQAERWLAVNQLMKDPEYQLLTLAHDLQQLGAFKGHDVELALTRYNAGASAKHVTSYGLRTYDLARELKTMYG